MEGCNWPDHKSSNILSPCMIVLSGAVGSRPEAPIWRLRPQQATIPFRDRTVLIARNTSDIFYLLQIFPEDELGSTIQSLQCIIWHHIHHMPKQRNNALADAKFND